MAGKETDPLWEQKLEALKARSLALEKDMARLLKSPDGNTNYRNDIIWLAEELNRLRKQVKQLESGGSQDGIQSPGKS